MKTRVVKHSCGHSAEWIVKGRGNPKFFKRVALEKCRACQLDDARRLTFDLPELRGTPAQIEWATMIRATLHRALQRTPHPDEDMIYRQTDAGWWIDKRHLGTAISAWIERAKGR